MLSACGSGTSSPTSSESYTTIAVTATAETEIYNNGNLSGVENNPTYDTTFDITDSYEVTSITDYHWNSGQGTKGGTIGLEDSDGNEIGTWPVTVRSGVYWDVHPNTVIDPGEYKVVDSDPSTWAQNLESDNSGITDVKGYAITYVVSKNTTNPTTNPAPTKTMAARSATLPAVGAATCTSNSPCSLRRSWLDWRWAVGSGWWGGEIVGQPILAAAGF